MTCGFFAKGLGGFIRSNKARCRLTGFSQYKAIQEVRALVYRLNKREERISGMIQMSSSFSAQLESALN